MEWKTTSQLRIFLDAKALYSILHLQEWLKLSKVNRESIFNDMAVICLLLILWKLNIYTVYLKSACMLTYKTVKNLRGN